MIDWWQSMIIFQQVMALFALPATAVLIIQTIMLLFGLGHDGGADAVDGGTDFAGDADGGIDFTGENADGLDDSWLSESSADFDSGLRLLTVRGLVAFFAAGGWVGIAAIDMNAPPWVAALSALIAGLGALWLVAFIFKSLLRLQSSGNIDLGKAIGGSGEVYLRIPGSMQGQGKVSIQVQERLIEASAMTRSETEIKTGTPVRVIAVRGDKLLVEPLDN
jgi:membrane protein implicated in regulation of membrane protease activity